MRKPENAVLHRPSRPFRGPQAGGAAETGYVLVDRRRRARGPAAASPDAAGHLRRPPGADRAVPPAVAGARRADHRRAARGAGAAHPAGARPAAARLQPARPLAAGDGRARGGARGACGWWARSRRGSSSSLSITWTGSARRCGAGRCPPWSTGGC